MKAKAIYSYATENADELSFAEGDTVVIVEQDDGDWWKAEQDGMVFLVPAGYLDTTQG